MKEGGEKELLSLQLMSQEPTAAWRIFGEDLISRGLDQPLLCIIDGNPGLRRAVAENWPRAETQRCLVHKLRNLEAHCPKRLRDELRRDFHAITQAGSEKAARRAFAAFVKAWQERCPGVARSLLEAGEELLAFYRFPKAQWKCQLASERGQLAPAALRSLRWRTEPYAALRRLAAHAEGDRCAAT